MLSSHIRLGSLWRYPTQNTPAAAFLSSAVWGEASSLPTHSFRAVVSGDPAADSDRSGQNGPLCETLWVDAEKGVHFMVYGDDVSLFLCTSGIPNQKASFDALCRDFV